MGVRFSASIKRRLQGSKKSSAPEWWRLSEHSQPSTMTWRKIERRRVEKTGRRTIRRRWSRARVKNISSKTNCRRQMAPKSPSSSSSISLTKQVSQSQCRTNRRHSLRTTSTRTNKRSSCNSSNSSKTKGFRSRKRRSLKRPQTLLIFAPIQPSQTISRVCCSRACSNRPIIEEICPRWTEWVNLVGLWGSQAMREWSESCKCAGCSSLAESSTSISASASSSWLFLGTGRSSIP